jgi:putative lipoprotein (rSAM/lipoprotein system)
MKTKLLKSYNSVITALLAILGFSAACLGLSSCKKYGSPCADFLVMGKVSSKETLQPIENIQISTEYDWNQTFTDKDGNYQLMHHCMNTFLVQFRDTANNYKDLDTLIEFQRAKEGKTVRKTLNIELTPKENEN